MATRTARSVARSSSLLPSQRPTARPALPASPSIAAAPRLRLAMAKTGDHPLIHGLLVSIFHGPTLGEFQAQLDEPGYEPVDRLIVKEGEEIAAHLRLARQTIQVGSATVSAARFMDLATATEYRSRGLATALLAAGERAAGPAKKSVVPLDSRRHNTSGLFPAPISRRSGKLAVRSRLLE